MRAIKKLTLLLFLICNINSFAQTKTTQLYPFKDAQGWGLAHTNGTPIFKERYDKIDVPSDYRTNRIKVTLNEKWGVIDTSGNVLLPIKFDAIAIGEFGYEIKVGEKWGFYNIDGREVLPANFDFILTNGMGTNEFFFKVFQKSSSDRLELMAIFTSDGVARTGFDYTSATLLDAHCGFCDNGSNGAYYLELEQESMGTIGLFDLKTKKTIIPPIYDQYTNIVIQQTYTPRGIGSFVFTGSDTVIHFINQYFQVLFDTEGVEIIHSNRIANWRKEKQYYVDLKGVWQPMNGECTEHLADPKPPYILRNTKNEYYFVDRYGARINSINYDDLSRIRSQGGVVNEYFLARKNPQDGTGMINLTFEIVIPSNYEEIKWNSYTHCFEARSKVGPRVLYDENGVQLENPKFRGGVSFYINDASEDLVKHFGLKRKNGEILVPANYPRWEIIDPSSLGYPDTVIWLSNNEGTEVYLYHPEKQKQLKFEGVQIHFLKARLGHHEAYLIIRKEGGFDLFNVRRFEYTCQDVALPSASIDANANDEIDFWSFKKDVYQNTEFIWILTNDDNWCLFDTNGRLLDEWKITEEGFPEIIYRSDSVKCYRLKRKTSNLESDLLVNESGKRMAIPKDALIQCNSQLNAYVLSYFDQGARYQLLDRAFNHLNEFKQLQILDGFYTSLDFPSKTISIYDSNHLLVHKSNLLHSQAYFGKYFEIRIDTNHYLFSSENLSTDLVPYRGIIQQSSALIFGYRTMGANSLVDVYGPKGKLLFKDCNQVSSESILSNRHKYFVLMKDNLELWMTELGEIYFEREL